MLGLFVSLALLGLAAIDPVGIAAMPILLLQKQPFKRSFLFLSGSFVSLMLMGLLFAQGFGQVILHLEKTGSWLVPSIEIAAGFVLLVIAGAVLWRIKTGRISVDPPDSIVKRLQLGSWQLFTVGAMLVTVQSTVDVVFAVAMVHIGQLHLGFTALLSAIATYAITALALQLVVVLAYKLTPLRQRTKILDKIHWLLDSYVNQILVGVSLLLGFTLLVMAVASIKP